MTYKKLTIKYDNCVFISDIHFGIRSASEEWQINIRDYFHEWFIPYLKKEIERLSGNVCLIVLGDVFDDRKNLNLAVNDMAIEIFSEMGKLLPIYILNGNHDLYKRSNQGVTSLKSLKNISNVTLITEPTIINLPNQKKAVAVPYLGDVSKESQCLLENQTCDYAFMHTDIAKMKYDNGQNIIHGVSADGFQGMIFSGHIHKRQVGKNIVYVGAPYQISRGDIGNKKGIYTLCFSTGMTKFKENKFSPIFQKILIDNYLELTIEERVKLLSNNYTDILITDSKKKYNIQEIYDLASQTSAKRLMVIFNTAKENIKISDEEMRDISIEDLIEDTIDNLEDTDDTTKVRLKQMSNNYLKSLEYLE